MEVLSSQNVTKIFIKELFRLRSLYNKIKNCTYVEYSLEAVVEVTVWGSPQGDVGPEDVTDKSEIDRKLRLLPVKGSSKES